MVHDKLLKGLMIANHGEQPTHFSVRFRYKKYDNEYKFNDYNKPINHEICS